MPRPIDQALVLRRTPYSESSLVVHALTAQHGRVHLVAKGAYRRTSRYFCVLDLFHTLELGWSTKAGRELDPLSQGDLLHRRRRLPLDPASYSAGASVLELLDLVTVKGQPEPALFQIAVQALDALDELRGKIELGAQAILLRFQLLLLEDLGLPPALGNCARCAGPAPGTGGRAAFSARAGGRLCPSCANEARREGARVGTLPEVVLGACAGAARGQQPPADLLERCLDFVSRFLDVHLEARLKSQRQFLAAANRNAPPRP